MRLKNAKQLDLLDEKNILRIIFITAAIYIETKLG